MQARTGGVPRDALSDGMENDGVPGTGSAATGARAESETEGPPAGGSF